MTWQGLQAYTAQIYQPEKFNQEKSCELSHVFWDEWSYVCVEICEEVCVKEEGGFGRVGDAPGRA